MRQSLINNPATVRGSIVPWALGMLLVAAGAADGHELVVSAREADWGLLLHADLELLGGFWLLSGRFPRAARIAAFVAFGGILAFDLATAIAGHTPQPVFGRVSVDSWWILPCDLVLLAALLWWRWAPRGEVRAYPHAGRWAAASLAAMALGLALERSQVGQYPIVATVRAGRTASGLDSLVYLPDGYYRSLRRWPVILALHGRGESGEDIDLVRRQGLPRRVEGTRGLPFIVVAPQSPDWLWDVDALDVLLNEVLRQYRVDLDRVYLTGNSMGGNGTWALATRRPERFAAIAPICGRGDPAWARRLRDVPTWAFHGAEDRIVPPEASERMVAALHEAGGDVRLTIYPGVGHDSWTPTYANPSFFEWLLKHRRGERPGGTSLRSPG